MSAMSVPRPGPSSASTSRFGLPSASHTDTHHTPMACAHHTQRATAPWRLSLSLEHPRTDAFFYRVIFKLLSFDQVTVSLTLQGETCTSPNI